MHAVVIYESLTGNTAKAGRAIAAELTAHGLPTQAFPIKHIDYQALSEAEAMCKTTPARLYYKDTLLLILESLPPNR